MRCIATVLGIALLTASCGKGDEVEQPPQAPRRPPMALDPNPPLSAQDIDAIVQQHKSGGVTAPANNGTHNDATPKGN